VGDVGLASVPRTPSDAMCFHFDTVLSRSYIRGVRF
jgi:hypothetical protein